MVGFARDILRRWLRDGSSEALTRLGQDVLRASTEATGRISRFDGIPKADEVLTDLEAAVTTLLGTPRDPPRWWSPRRRTGPQAPSPVVVAPVLERLERQRDAIELRIIQLAGDREKIAATQIRLDDAAKLIRAVRLAFEAAAREIAGEDPRRSAAIREEALPLMLEREQAVLTQMTVGSQAISASDLLIANCSTLRSALESAGTATLSALQVAIATRRAIADRQVLSDFEAIAASERGPAEESSGRTTESPGPALGRAVGEARSALGALDMAKSRWPRPPGPF